MNNCCCSILDILDMKEAPRQLMKRLHCTWHGTCPWSVATLSPEQTIRPLSPTCAHM